MRLKISMGSRGASAVMGVRSRSWPSSGFLASPRASPSQTRVVTVAIEGMSFVRPVRVGDRVACYAWVEKVGRTSMVIPVEVWVQRYMSGEEVLVTKGVFTYVALGSDGQPVPVPTAA